MARAPRAPIRLLLKFKSARAAPGTMVQLCKRDTGPAIAVLVASPPLPSEAPSLPSMETDAYKGSTLKGLSAAARLSVPDAVMRQSYKAYAGGVCNSAPRMKCGIQRNSTCSSVTLLRHRVISSGWLRTK